MVLVVVVDQKNGMAFAGKRQSMDRALRTQLLKTVGDAKLLMNEYSFKQFTDGGNITVDENFLENAQNGDYCFVENVDITPFLKRIEKVVLYRWDKVYPSSVKFPVHLLEEKWKLIDKCDFAGNSHEKITEEIYEL